MFRNIVVGISGGVDSAVATLLLKRKGFNVTAVFLKNWDTADETGKCLADEDFKDAQWVCKKLDVPLLQVDFVKEYWHEVFTYLVDSYERGQTPNPDIICNKNIKFNKFYEYARNNLSADAIATGHYAKSSFGSYLENYRPDSKVKLLNAADTIKDQTFFLSQVRQVPLQRCMFPLGDYKKTDVKKIAVENGLDIIAKKAESMGICFIGNRTFQNFISEYIEDKPGNFVDYDTGKIVGKHKGFHLWTLGQKCGIAGAPKPYFIYRKDSNSNDILVVQGTDHPALFTRLIVTSKPYWIHEEPRELSNSGVLECDFKFQRSHPAVPCKVFKTPSNRLIIQLAKAKRAISPGQFAVFYLNNECLGSAPIAQPGPSLQAIGETIDSDLDEFLDIGYRATI